MQEHFSLERPSIPVRHSGAGLKITIGFLAALVSIGAGLYLLGSESASADTTVFDALMHGIGGYLIARGLWMISSLIRG